MFLFEICQQEPKPLEHTTLTHVDSLEKLLEMMQTLKQHTEIAVDLEV